MQYKYKLLKTSWGIVIFLDIDEILNPSINETDIKVADKIYLRVSDTYRLNKEVIIKWMGPGIKSLSGEIYKKTGNVNVCYDVKEIVFNYVDFQEEGLYCAIREWIAIYYEIPLQPIEVIYDKAQNRYVFDILHRIYLINSFFKIM